MIVVVTGVLLADVVTKAWAVRQGGAGGASSPVRIVHVANRGGSVGLGQGHPHLVATGATLGTFAVAWYPATFNLADVAIRGGVVAAPVIAATRPAASDRLPAPRGAPPRL